MRRRSHLRHERRAESRRSARTAARSLARRSGTVLGWRSPCCRPQWRRPRHPHRATDPPGRSPHAWAAIYFWSRTRSRSATSWRRTCATTSTGSRPPARSARPRCSCGASGPTRCCWTSACRTARASSSAAASATAATATRTSGSSSSRRTPRSRTASAASSAAPTTSWSSPSATPSCWRAWRRCWRGSAAAGARRSRRGRSWSTSPRAACSCPASGSCCRRKEFELLATLARDPLRVHTKSELMQRIWGYRAPASTRTLDSHASRLRRRLEARGDDDERWIVNHWGVGYALRASTL